MKYLFFIEFLFFIVFLSSCEKDDLGDEIFTVEVLCVGMDCGDTYLIQFRDEDEKKVNSFLDYTNAYFPIFYADNLPEKYKEEGLVLNIKIGKCASLHAVGCTAMGPGYGHICVDSAEPISIALE